jgi:hypothetical protein
VVRADAVAKLPEAQKGPAVPAKPFLGMQFGRQVVWRLFLDDLLVPDRQLAVNQ